MSKTQQSVLIIDPVHPSIFDMFRARNVEADYRPDISRAEVLKIAASYEGIVVRSKTAIDRALIDKAKRLKFVARAGSGLENMDIDALSSRNIRWVNAPEGNRDTLGEHAVGTLLSLMHKLHTADAEVRQKIWNRETNRGMELKGKTVGIFGYGFMGSAFAEKLSGFGCRILAYDKYKTGFGDENIEECSLETFMKQTEILSIHVLLTPETKGLFSMDFVKRFDKIKLLINTARGGLITNATLVSLIKEGFIMGAGLDVLENEKIHTMDESQIADFEFLSNSPKVLLTPHVGGWSHESYRRINEVMVDKLEKLNLIPCPARRLSI